MSWFVYLGDDSSEDDLSPTHLPPVTHVSQPDPSFFAEVDKDVHKIMHKEKIQEQYQMVMTSAFYAYEIQCRQR